MVQHYMLQYCMLQHCYMVQQCMQQHCMRNTACCNTASTCRLDADAANMVGCYFHAHRPQDGQWLPADAMPKSDTGQPIAYVAKGAHGLYTGVSDSPPQLLLPFPPPLTCTSPPAHPHLRIPTCASPPAHPHLHIPTCRASHHDLDSIETIIHVIFIMVTIMYLSSCTPMSSHLHLCCTSVSDSCALLCYPSMELSGGQLCHAVLSHAVPCHAMLCCDHEHMPVHTLHHGWCRAAWGAQAGMVCSE